MKKQHLNQKENLAKKGSSPKLYDGNLLNHQFLVQKPKSSQNRYTPQLTSQNNKRLKTSGTISSLSQGQLLAEADKLQKEYCKLVVLSEDKEQKEGFQTAQQLMMTNKSWTSRLEEFKEIKTEPSEVGGTFPCHLQNRLDYNFEQTCQYEQNMNQKWQERLQEVKNKYMNRQKQMIKMPRVRIIHHDTQKQIEKQKEIEEDEEDDKQHSEQLEQMNRSNMKLIWYSISITEQWTPSMREGASFIHFDSMSKCYMYGGIGRDLFNNFVVLNLKNWNWENIGPGSGDAPQVGRFGHSTNVYKNQILIFGGERKFNTSMKMRECYGDIRIYSPMEHAWQQLRTYGEIAEARRNHCSAIVGRFLFIMGGISSYGKYLNDICALNLDSLKWTILQTENFYEQGIAFSTAKAIFRSEVKVDNPYFGYELVKKKGKRLVKLVEEGIYVFGGRLQDGKASNQLQVIKIGNKPISSKLVKPKGIGPSARYYHSMDYHEQLNILIIYGGRDDNTEYSETIKNDFFILDIENLIWVQINHIGFNRQGRCNHSSVIIDTKLLIFGGYCQNSFANSNLTFIELEQQKSRMMFKHYKQRLDIKGKKDLDQEFILSKADLKSDVTLKLLTMDITGQGQKQAQEQVIQREKEKAIDTLNFKNFRSFLPQPIREASNLIKEFKIKRQQERSATQIEMQSRRGSRMSTRLDDNFVKKLNSHQTIVPIKVVEDKIGEEEQ